MAEAVFPIRSGDYRAEVVSVGAGLRKLERTVAGRPWPLTETWQAGSRPPLSAGLVLAPWPNRIYNGRFTFAGVEHQLEITEPARYNAIHGLVRRREWTVEEHVEHRVVQSIEIGLQQGWPYPLRLTLTYEIGPDGLTVTTTATNIGSVPAPYGFGMHAFMRAGDAPLDVCTLQLPAGVFLPLDPDYLVPTGGSLPVEGTGFDFRTARPVKGVWLDTPFSALVSELDGRVRAALRPPKGPTTILWVEPRFRWLQVFTADPAHGQAYPGRGRALAVEPMTCPPDAFNSGIDVIVLDPGKVWRGSWGMTCV
ncbi:MAG: aldose 1-epimerase family protein [Mycobacteriaceae bacterium]|nr:aldose 1-epimerase family protein [Mycobacteriaceae bacterium]